MPTETILSTVVDADPHGIIYADRDGIIRLWNRAAEALFGHAAERALGQSLDLIVPEKLRAAHWRGFNHAMETGEARLGGRFIRTKAVHIAGHNIYVELAFQLVKDDTGAMVGSVAYCRPSE
jgi:PAS domain S-box-containing protein